MFDITVIQGDDDQRRFPLEKTVGPLRTTVFRGLRRVGFQFLVTMASCNLVRMRRLLAPGAT